MGRNMNQGASDLQATMPAKAPERGKRSAGDALTRRPFVLDPAGLDRLLGLLSERGYTLVGPTVRDGAIIYEEIRGTRDLPAGWTDEQTAGQYRLRPRDDDSLFGYVVGPHSWKTYLFPPVQRLWQVTRNGRSLNFQPEHVAPVSNRWTAPRLALIGVRPCEIHAIAVQDRVFTEGDHVDPGYRARRDNVFIVAVNCGEPGGTCFCASMNTGPRATDGFDLCLTEVAGPSGRYYVVEASTDAGAGALRDAPSRGATDAEREESAAVTRRAFERMGRALETAGIRDLLYRNYEHRRWDDAAKRCLSCGNCTLVCPTCFCSTVEDATDLSGERAERRRTWDSCFTMDFSYTHGGSVRPSVRARYRHWMTHKLAAWHDQFGTSGCVGCGRCITWCPVGIDITDEAAAIRQNDGGGRPAPRAGPPPVSAEGDPS